MQIQSGFKSFKCKNTFMSTRGTAQVWSLPLCKLQFINENQSQNRPKLIFKLGKILVIINQVEVRENFWCWTLCQSLKLILNLGYRLCQYHESNCKTAFKFWGFLTPCFFICWSLTHITPSNVWMMLNVFLCEMMGRTEYIWCKNMKIAARLPHNIFKSSGRKILRLADQNRYFKLWRKTFF